MEPLPTPVRDPAPELPRVSSLLVTRAREWTGILSAYFTAQTLTQLLGIATGLLFVNFLSVRQFALYALATSVLSFLSFTSDLGSTASLLHFFRESGRTGEPFGDYFRAVLSLRRAIFAAGAVAVLAAFPLTASAKGFGTAEALAATAGILLGVWFQISSSLRLLGLRLHGRYNPSYRAELLGAALRLLLAVVMVAGAVLHAWLAVLVSAAGSMLVARLSDSALAHPAAASSDLRPYRLRVVRYLLPTLPSALFFSAQGPLVIWLAATFGEAQNVAEVGALSRLGLIVGLLSGLIGAVFLPRLAAMTDDARYRLRCLQYGLLLALAALALFAAASLLPGPFLALIGPHYKGLHRELLLIVAGSGFALLGSYFMSVNFARGWTRFQSATAILELAAQIVLIKLLPLSTTRGVLLFTLLSAVTGLVLQGILLELGFRRPAWVRWRHA
jgi:O-antigen/teichoic acid export membrane protein